MPILHKAIQLLGKPLPKVASPKAHAIADYSTALLFVLGAGLFWNRSKRAAVASLICAAAETGIAAFTDYPGGLKRIISFPLHKKMDVGLSTMVATMPEFLAFEDQREKNFFHLQAALIAAATVLTNFEPQVVPGEQERIAA
jgi:hypothetical protein